MSDQNEFPIEVENLTVHYRSKSGPIPAVQGLSFAVRPGEIVGFLGPNGAGKSSTLKALMGFVQPTGGSCTIFGAEAGSLAGKANVGYLPEVALYYPYLTPFETLMLYGQLQGLGGKSLEVEAEHLLERVGLFGAMRKQNRTLSKGMLQRVGIAQSLLGSPPLLILDEVTSGLDPVGRKELREILKERQRQGATLFFSSHELAEIDMLCDRILLVHKGRLLEERDIHELKDSVRRFELKFMGADLATGYESMEKFGRERVARFSDKGGLLAAIDAVTRGGGQIQDVVSQEGSLEDYFIDTIGRAA